MSLFDFLWPKKEPKVELKKKTKVEEYNVGYISILITYRDPNGNLVKHEGSFTGHCEWESNPFHGFDDEVPAKQVKVVYASSKLDEWLNASGTHGFLSVLTSKEPNCSRFIPKDRVLDIFVCERDFTCKVYYGPKPESTD